MLEFSVIIVFCEYLWCICLTFLSVFFLYVCRNLFTLKCLPQWLLVWLHVSLRSWCRITQKTCYPGCIGIFSHILYNLAGWIRCSQFFSFWMSLFEWQFYSSYQTNAFLLWRNITLLNNTVCVHKFGQIEYFYAYDMTCGPTLMIVIFTKKDRFVC